LASLTLLIAESDPKEKEVMVAITMDCLHGPNTQSRSNKKPKALRNARSKPKNALA
jgi:hypothetical protein